ncbi:hypothetical protein KAT92_03925 [Candidatus Babeliales bacterium]|nr:hypothetical protein [Candidatus Babeliales bacterium]
MKKILTISVALSVIFFGCAGNLKQSERDMSSMTDVEWCEWNRNRMKNLSAQEFLNEFGDDNSYAEESELRNCDELHWDSLSEEEKQSNIDFWNQLESEKTDDSPGVLKEIENQ